MQTQIEFRDLVAGELTLSADGDSRDTWTLEHQGGLVGKIQRRPGATRVRGRSACWEVERGRHRLATRLVFRPVGGDDQMLSYYRRRLLPGGTLALSEQRWFELRPPGLLFGKGWLVSDQDGMEFTRIRISSHGVPAREWVFHLDEGAETEPAALIIVLATCYAIVTDQAERPLFTGGW